MIAETRGIRIRHRGHEPQIHPTAYVAPTATLVGDVRVGARARVMYGAVLDAEGSRIEVGETVICENAVLRGSAVAGDQPVLVDDHVFVGPHATLLGCEVGRCVYVATTATVLQCAWLGAGAVVAVGALVHARTVVPDEYFVPPHTVALDAPVRLLAPGDPGLAEAVGRPCLRPRPHLSTAPAQVPPLFRPGSNAVCSLLVWAAVRSPVSSPISCGASRCGCRARR
ncbi:gamma carbonic anhydrase family protein [Streptomyces rimosus]|uniref:gamma carbonic anhydrase family protein n=1 Tax=Streptomyces rimosus TaxID=1927 RepID=UPI0037A271E9